MESYVFKRNSYSITINVIGSDLFYKDGLNLLLEFFFKKKGIIDFIKNDKKINIFLDTNKQFFSDIKFDNTMSYNCDKIIYITSKKKIPNIFYRLKSEKIIMIEAKSSCANMEEVLNKALFPLPP